MQLVSHQRGTGHYTFFALFGGNRFDRKLSQIDFDFARKMQFTGRKKGKIIKLEGTENAGKYLHGLQMYKIPPTDNITLEEFEEFAIDRLKGEITNRN